MDGLLFNICRWLAIGLLVAGALANAYAVGRPRKPLTGGGACVAIVIDALLIAVLLAARP